MIKEKFKEQSLALVDATIAKEQYEYEYSILEAQKMFSAEVQGLGNQSQRDAQLKLLLKEEYKKLVDVRTDYRLAYYKWQTTKTLLESK